MAKYRVRVTVTDETGVRRPKAREVKWYARRLVEPYEDFGQHELIFSTRTDRDGVLSGMYTCIQHAESLGETLALDEIEVEVEYVTLYLKRKKVDRVQRHTVKLGYRDVYDEIMSRPRPLA